MKSSACLLAALLVLLAAGCATTPKINWAERVGHHTFDEVVIEIGPPDKQAKLTDGTVVAEWVTQRSRAHAFVSGGYGWSGPYGYGMFSPANVDTVTTPEYFLRLTFGPDGKLAAWKKFAR
ncbi:MAG: hypothetical protein NTZ16_04995 [Verrucomicrobia bacterium]|nr:hypothetical protein [Verrucomicrobiota bacterium]